MPGQTRFARTTLGQLAAGFAFAIAACAAHAIDVGGVALPDSVKVGATDLRLNGAGVRTFIIVKVYVGALYLPEKTGSAAAVLEGKGAKRISMHLLRDLSAERLGKALDEGLEKNLTAAEHEKMAPQIEALHAAMNAVGDAKEKSVVTLDYLPESDSTRVTLNGAPVGKPIAGADFYRALLKVWIGDHPAQSDLKAAMLGQTKG